MVLQELFDQGEIDMIIHALNAQEKKWQAVLDRPAQGYGSANEFENGMRQADKIQEYRNLLSKITELTI
jgi:hypothetical protein